MRMCWCAFNYSGAGGDKKPNVAVSWKEHNVGIVNLE